MHIVFVQAQHDMLGLFDGLVAHAPALLVSLVVLIVTRSVARWVGRSARAVGARTVRSVSLRMLLEKTATIGAWAAGVLLAALIGFPGLRLGDVVATLGLTSVAIGFAFADIFKNFLAGILLLINEPFRIGDQIIVGAYEGTVEQIDIRFTELRTYMNERVLVPNATVFTMPVQVRTAHGHRRIDVPIGLTYGVDVERAIAVMRDALRGVEGVREEPEPRVDLVEFGDSSANFVIRFWAGAMQMEHLTVQTRAMSAVYARLGREGIEIAFPTRTIVLPAGAPGSVSAAAP